MHPGVHRFPNMDRVIYGAPFAESLAREVERLDAHAVFVLASGTLARETDMLDQLRAALGNDWPACGPDRRPHAAHRCGGRRQRSARGQGGRAGDDWRRLGDRCGENGRAVPGQ